MTLYGPFHGVELPEAKGQMRRLTFSYGDHTDILAYCEHGQVKRTVQHSPGTSTPVTDARANAYEELRKQTKCQCVPHGGIGGA